MTEYRNQNISLSLTRPFVSSFNTVGAMEVLGDRVDRRWWLVVCSLLWRKVRGASDFPLNCPLIVPQLQVGVSAATIKSDYIMTETSLRRFPHFCDRILAQKLTVQIRSFGIGRPGISHLSLCLSTLAWGDSWPCSSRVLEGDREAGGAHALTLPSLDSPHLSTFPTGSTYVHAAQTQGPSC